MQVQETARWEMYDVHALSTPRRLRYPNLFRTQIAYPLQLCHRGILFRLQHQLTKKVQLADFKPLIHYLDL